jgi:hypothetical protein
VGVTAGSREVPGRKTVTREDDDDDDDVVVVVVDDDDDDDDDDDNNNNNMGRARYKNVFATATWVSGICALLFCI